MKAVKLDKEWIARKAKNVIDKIDQLEYEYKNEVDGKKIEILSEKVKKLFDILKGIRKEALKSGNEISPGNILYKILRRIGYLGKLIDLKSLTFDRINSIK